MLDKRTKFKMQFNNIIENLADPTLLDAEIIIHDFEVSENKQCITREVCEENKDSLIGKRITCQYISADNNNGLDALGDHGEYVGIDRNGNEHIYTDTIAIGFIKDVYIGTHDNKECLMGKCVLWRDDKYKDITDLLIEWDRRGIKICCSCEYLYLNYEVKDGIEYIKSPIIYTAHTVLNSEERGDACIVQPAYDIAAMSFNEIKSWNNAINTLNTKTHEKGVVDMGNKIFEMRKSSNAISIGDLEYKIWESFGRTLTNYEFRSMWLSEYNIYSEEKYVIVELLLEDKYSCYKVMYSIDENDDVIVDWENRIEVEYVTDYKEVVANLTSTTEELQSLNTKHQELEKSLNEKMSIITTLETAKDNVEVKLNESNEIVITLNNKINELQEEIIALNNVIENMKPIVEEYERVEFEKQLTSLQELYADKFSKINAMDVYELESTQLLIRDTINDTTNESLLKLNQLLVDSIKTTIKVDANDEGIKSVNSIIKPKKQDHMSLTDIYEETCGFQK